MLCFWAAKGGSGCSVIAAAVAIMAAKFRTTLLVDLGGDLPAILAVEASEAGVADWLAADRPPPDALARLEVEVGRDLSLLPLGANPSGAVASPDRVSILARLLADDDRSVIVDLGSGLRGFEPLVDLASASLLVTRPCYMAIRRAESLPRPDGVVLIVEPGRSLRPTDIAEALAAPIETTVRLDPSVARAVDAGTLGLRLPRSLARLQTVAQMAAAAGSR